MENLEVQQRSEINIESRYSNCENIVYPMSITYKKISFWEYGFNLEPNTGDEIYGIEMEIYKIKEKSLLVKFHATDNKTKYMAINKRGEAIIQFGYNSGGDFITIENEGGKPFNFKEINKVYITSLDHQHENLKYYWGRNGDLLNGYLDKMKRTAFYMYIKK